MVRYIFADTRASFKRLLPLQPCIFVSLPLYQDIFDPIFLSVQVRGCGLNLVLSEMLKNKRPPSCGDEVMRNRDHRY